MQTKTNWYIIVNPAAGNGVARRLWLKMEPVLLKQIPDAVVVHTEYPDHIIDLVKDAVQNGFRQFIAVGGDGTNHEMANGILNQKIIPSVEITYALLPVGTGNDWIRTYGIPRKLGDWMQMLEAGKTCLQDVGHLNYYAEGVSRQRYFANVAGLAYDGFVVQYIEKNKTKVKNGFFYLFMIMRCLFKYKLRKARITFDGQQTEGFHYTINAGICKYSGGGMSLVPHAVPDDGLLALTIAGKISKVGILLNTWRFYNGSITKHAKIEGHLVKKITVEALTDSPILLEADGEFLGEAPVKITLVEKALKIIIP